MASRLSDWNNVSPEYLDADYWVGEHGVATERLKLSQRSFPLFVTLRVGEHGVATERLKLKPDGTLALAAPIVGEHGVATERLKHHDQAYYRVLQAQVLESMASRLSDWNSLDQGDCADV